MLEYRNWLKADARFGCVCSVGSDTDGDVSMEIDVGHDTVCAYWNVEEARRIVDAINAAIAYIESSTAVASCVAAMDATKGGDSDDNQ